MECYDCGKTLRYVDKKYPTSEYKKGERIIHYRCRSCYSRHKEVVKQAFKGGGSRVY